MDQFISFVINHWVLWLALVFILALLLLQEFQDKLRGVSAVMASQLTLLMNHEEAVAVDIRDSHHFNTSHILGAINIPVAELSEKVSQLTGKKKAIILIDASGQQAANAAVLLRKHGINDVRILKGGMTSWQNDRLPLVKSK